MPFFVTPNIIALVILTVLVVIGSAAVIRRLRGSYERRRKFMVLKLDKNTSDIRSILNEIKSPFVFEIAVAQLGSKPSCYITVPISQSKKFMIKLGAKEVDDYETYYPNGVNIGAYLKGDGALADFNIDKIDFGEINEIGEGAVVQFVLRKIKKGELETNVRLLVSAPSMYQAKEILSRIKSSLGKFKFVEVNNVEFMTRVNLRTFEPKELLMLSM